MIGSCEKVRKLDVDIPHHLGLTRCGHQVTETGKEPNPMLESSQALAEEKMQKLDVDIPHHLGLTRCGHQVTETDKEPNPMLESSQALAEVSEEKMQKLDVDIPHHLGLTRCCHLVTETGKEQKPILESTQTLAEVSEEKMQKLDVDIPRHLGLICHQVTETGKEHKPILESTQTLEKVNEDGILSSILSFLNMRDAVRSSILSRRWGNLWTFIPNLDFNSPNMLENDLASHFDRRDLFSRLSSAEQEIILSSRANKFIHSVNEFLHRHQGTGVNIFNVNFSLTKEHAHHLDKWVEFAIGAGAKRLILDLCDSMVLESSNDKLYDFPFHLFDNGKGCSIDSICVAYCYFSPHATFTGFSSLKILSLSYLYITDMQIGILLSYCFVIESLSIDRCNGLVNFDIFQRSRRLNLLVVNDCPGLLKIELDSIVLKFLVYSGDWPMLCLKNAARILNVSIDLEGSSLITNSFLSKLTDQIPQLEGLSLDYNVPKEVGITSTSYKSTHLKKLFLHTNRSWETDAFGLVLVLNSAPLLEEFHVNISGLRRFGPGKKQRKIVKSIVESMAGLSVPDTTHMKLRQFELGGFDGWKDEVELVSYVMRNAVALEIVSVDCTFYRHSFIGGWWKGSCAQFNSTNGEAHHEAFQQLSQIPRPPGAKLVLRW